MGRTLLVLLVFLAGGSALATPQQYKEAVKGAVQGMTLDEIIQWSNREFRRQATVGRYVRWGGSIVLGSALIAAGLDYFYNYLRRETGTPLDQWYYWAPSVVAVVGNYGAYEFHNCGWWGCTSFCVQTYNWSAYGWTYRGMIGAREEVWGPHNGRCEPSPAESQAHFLSQRVPSQYRSGTFRPVSPQDVNGVPPEHRSRFQADLSWARHALVLSSERPPLSDWLQQHPNAADGVKRAVTTYLDAVQPASPSQPWPGVRLDPVPNPNQWTDNPFTRPDIDTDGDGYPDWVEWYEANRRGVPWPDLINNPTAHPDPKGDPDGDGFTTWEEISVGTNPYDPNSRPARRPAPSIDTDGDGWPDAEEIKRGTDPTNPNDYPYNLPYDRDTDGDGVPDWKEIESGTDPYSPESRPEQRPEDQPKDEGWPGGPPVPGLKEVEFPTREAERRPLPELDRLLRPWEEQVVQRWQEAVGQLKQVLSGKFPFALVLALSRVSVSRGSAECVFSVSIGPAQATVAPCNTPIFQTMESFRPVLAGLFWLTFVLAMVRRGLDVQR